MNPRFETGAVGRVDAGDVTMAFEWWPGPGPLVGLHGLTSHRGAFAALADVVSPSLGVLAFDLRGRGDSEKPPGPHGIAVHAADVVGALDALGLDAPVVLAGHSMGAWVVAAIAARRPERVAAAILLDGGDYRVRSPAGAPTAGAVPGGLVGDRLHRTWSSPDELCEALAATPLYQGRVDASVHRYFAFDLHGERGTLTAKADPVAVAADWQEIVEGVHRADLGRLRCPTLLVTAPGGLTGQDDPVISEEVRYDMEARIPDLTVVDLPGENHHTFMTTMSGASRTAGVVRAFLDTIQKARKP